MLRIPINERPHWPQLANEVGFKFHTINGERYWDERAYYQFSLAQIENDLEAPTEEIHQMCLEVVDRVVRDEQLLTKFAIPKTYWQWIYDSWQRKDPSLYSRLDFAYDGTGPAKLYENNADTPTSLYETGYWQWLWLEEQVDAGLLPKRTDQFNGLQEALIRRFATIERQVSGAYGLHNRLLVHFASCKGTEEDRGTVQYLEDCAREAGIVPKFIYVEDIGLNAKGQFVDLDGVNIEHIFKLYPWEFMFRETYGEALLTSKTQYIEPPWKSVLSNKALLPMLWRYFPNHPNLLPAFFEGEPLPDASHGWIKKPIFSREGANIAHVNGDKEAVLSVGPYGEEGYILQKAHYLPQFGQNHTLIGSWLVDGVAAGISIREDHSAITQDSSRYLPHVIID
ncbi:MAG: glutathionylspermidine synthase family protein [Pontibacterium sp.]